MGVKTLVGLSALLYAGRRLSRPVAIPAAYPGPEVRKLAVDVVRRHGRDTLAFFKLRPDKHYYFNADRTAFVGYRVHAGTLLLSGDPVGPPEAFPQLLREVYALARSKRLKLAALGASPELVPVYHQLGLRTLYIGDEAVIEMNRFTLRGRPIRKVRQSVNRLTRAGYSSELRSLDQIGPAAMLEIERVLEIGRIGKTERGFAWGMDSIRGEREHDTLFIVTRDGSGRIRGVLHFVPCYGRAAVSVSVMRRDPDTPNGLMEFQIVNAIELLRERGLEEMSLNFAALTKYLRNPEGPLEHVLGHVSKLLNRSLQIESLYRFNVKFFPRWDPRYLVYEGRFGIPRAGIASMLAEGQIPRPGQSRRQRPRSRG